MFIPFLLLHMHYTCMTGLECPFPRPHPIHQLTNSPQKLHICKKKVELNSALYKTVAASLYRYAVYVKTQIYFKFEIEFIYLK